MQNTSPPLKISLFGLLTALALAPGSTLFGQTSPPQFNFTMTQAAPRGYSNFTAGDQAFGTTPVYAFEFTVDITAVNDVPTTLPAIAAFCIELAEDTGIDGIGQSSYTSFDSEYLYKASAGRAGEEGTTSLNIPTGGIGQLRAAQVRYLFDKYYASSDLVGWVRTVAVPDVQAFQLSLWEITHDTDFSLSSGSLYIGAQTGPPGIGLNTRNNAILLAQSWLTAIDAANITESYESTKYDVYTLTSTTGNTDGRGYQDIVLASLKTAPIVPLQPIPEPSSALLVVIGALFAMRRRR